VLITIDPGLHPLWRLSVSQFHAMRTQGILAPDNSVELLEGILVQKTPESEVHRSALDAIRQAMERALPRDWHVVQGQPITLESSEPECDLAIVRGDPRDYSKRHPEARDVALAIEVAGANPDRDRLLKRRVYAAGRIPAYWLIDLNRRCMEIFTAPLGNDYRRTATLGPAQQCEFSVGDVSRSVPVRELLP
jgi:Uma2 family endonuclease